MPSNKAVGDALAAPGRGRLRPAARDRPGRSPTPWLAPALVHVVVEQVSAPVGPIWREQALNWPGRRRAGRLSDPLDGEVGGSDAPSQWRYEMNNVSWPASQPNPQSGVG